MREVRCYCDWACGHGIRYEKETEDYEREWKSTLLYRFISGELFRGKKITPPKQN